MDEQWISTPPAVSSTLTRCSKLGGYMNELQFLYFYTGIIWTSVLFQREYGTINKNWISIIGYMLFNILAWPLAAISAALKAFK